MIEALIVAGCYTAFWSNAGGAGAVARPLIFVFLALAASWAIIRGKVRRIATTPTEILLYGVGMLSAAVAMVRAEEYSIIYSMYYLGAIVLISVLARTVSLDRLLDLGAVVTILCILTCIAVERSNLVTALSISVGRYGLIRFSPLSNHPLLIGDIFGSGSILMIRRLYLSRSTLERWVMAAGLPFAWVFIMAASARSSVVGLASAAVFAVVVEFRLTKVLFSKRLGLVMLALAALVFVYLGPAHNYLQDIFAVNNAYRGVGTGATGRTDLWRQGIESLSDPSRLAFGGALRSSEVGFISFSTESSYITILMDSGIFAGSALIALFLYAPIGALRLSRSVTGGRNPFAFLPSFFVFLLVQCFFIRDLVGIGNPISLMTLFYITSLSLSIGFRASADANAKRSVAQVPVVGGLPNVH
jgi:hypothetical protein